MAKDSITKISIVGAGGLGSPAALGIISSWPNVNALELSVIDGDVIQRSNLNRQILFRDRDIGANKAEVLTHKLREFLPERSTISLRAIPKFLTLENFDEHLLHADYIVDCCDSTEIKFALNDYCVRSEIALCYAGAVGTRGLLLQIRPGSPCLRCLFGSPTLEELRVDGPACQTAGILGPVAGFIGSLQAKFAIDYVLNHNHTHSDLLRFDGMTLDLKYSAAFPDPNCPLGCGRKWRTLDLRTKRCPETFLFTKLGVEQLQPEEGLEVLLFNQETAESVASSAREERLQVFTVRAQGQDWSVRVAPKSE